MKPWFELSQRFLDVHALHDGLSIEARVGPTEGLAPEDVLDAFRECTPDDAAELRRMLGDKRHRLFVKLLILATRTVPEPLFEATVRAGVMTQNPSFNKHFIWPCTIAHGRRRVMKALLAIFERGSDREKYGVAGAVYWCLMPREQTYWPLSTETPSPRPSPDEPIDDVCALFEKRAVEELIRNPVLDIRRALLPFLPRARAHHPELAARALQILREEPDEYVQQRLAHDLGESNLLPCMLAPSPKPKGADVPTTEALIEQMTQLGRRPAAFQALWDGDTEGWMVCLEAVFASGATHAASNLVVLRFGGDIRVFQGAVPPWPEARVATELGEALARHFGVPFWFPSPTEPDDDCPSWWERDRARACEDCGKPIRPRDPPHLPREVCDHCGARREARARLQRDEPADPAGVTVLLGAPGEERQILYSSDASRLRIARFAIEALGRADVAPPPAELVIEGDELRRFEAHLQGEVQALIARFDRRSAREAPSLTHPPAALGEAAEWQRRQLCPDGACIGVIGPDSTCKVCGKAAAAAAAAAMLAFAHFHRVAFEGRELELELRFDDLAQDLHSAISDLETARRAIREGLRYWLVFHRGMTVRGHLMLRLLRHLEGRSTLAVLAEWGELDANEVRAALARLAELGHVLVQGDDVRLTPTGWHVCS